MRNVMALVPLVLVCWMPVADAQTAPPYDLAGSRAHARALHAAALLSDSELAISISIASRDASVESSVASRTPTCARTPSR